MKYFSVNLYKKILNCAIAEGMSPKDFENWPISLEDAKNLKFISADDHLKAHELLDEKLKTMSTFLGLGNITKVEALGAFSPIQMLEATLSRYAYERKQVFPKSWERKEREDFEGAFVFEPDPGLYEWVASFDFASLYPSIMRQFKISIENFITKDKHMQTNDNHIKCASGAVFDASFDPLIPEILTNYYSQRKDAKKVSQQADMELSQLQKIKEERLKSTI